MVALVGYYSIQSNVSDVLNAIAIPSPSQSTETESNTKPGTEEALMPSELVASSKTIEEHKTPSAAAAAAIAGCVVDARLKSSLSTITIGSENSYDVTVTNLGSEYCQNVTYSLYYAANQGYVSATPRPVSGNYYWRVGSLAPGVSHEMKLVLKHVPSDESDMLTEMCATADNGQDSCVTTTVAIGDSAMQAPDSTPAEVIAQPVPVAPSRPLAQEYGVWVWESPVQMSSTRAALVVQAAAEHRFNVIYITIDDYLEIAAMGEGSTKKAKEDAYFLALSKIVTNASAKGIAIDVEGGWRDWAIAENRWKGYALIDFVKKYNERYPQAKVRGLQYDVEPYLLPTYERNKVGALKPFLEFIDESTTRMEKIDATFTVVIPHFYDSAQKWTPAINYRGETKHTFTHLLEILERKPGSTITIMSYRNFFEGKDGTEHISKAEMVEATTGRYLTKVVVAQETGNVDPAYVTFYGQSRSQLLSNVEQIRTGFEAYGAFGGVAIHYLDPYLQLK